MPFWLGCRTIRLGSFFVGRSFFTDFVNRVGLLILRYHENVSCDFCFRMQAVLARHPMAQALEHSLGMLVITDAAGIAVYANEGAVRRTGYAIAETIGKKPGRLWGGHMTRNFYDSLWADLRRVRPVVTDLENQRKNGQLYRERVHIAPLVREKGDTPFFIAVQPFHLEDTGSMDRFGADFKRVFGTGGRISDTRFFGWVNRWFGTEAISMPRGKGRYEVVNFIENELVHPMRERFAAREEDRILIEAAQSDAREFRRLYTKYEVLVKRYFLRHLSFDEDMADDLTQETFYRALVYLPGFAATNASYGTYLLRVAHNLLVNHYRKKQIVALFDNQDQEAAVSDMVAVPQVSGRILDMPALRASEREILSMKYEEGFSAHEIAALLGVSENAVKLRLSRARKHLRELL